MRAFARWQALNGREKWRLVQSAAALAVAAATLRALGAARSMRLASRRVRGRTIDDREIDLHVAAMDRAGRYVPAGTCLAQSLALLWMLRGNGVAAELRYGVHSRDGFEAHAWLESGGVALTDARGAKSLVGSQRSRADIDPARNG